MKTLAFFLASALVCLAVQPIEHGAKIYIEPCGGFEVTLAAAIQGKHVPVTIVTTKEAADYVLEARSDSQKAGWAKTIFVSPRSEEQASVRMVNKAGEVVFAYAVDKFASVHGRQSTAEACAKHLRKAMNRKS